MGGVSPASNDPGSIWAANWASFVFVELQERGLRPADLARASGLTASRISNWKAGKIRPTTESCIAVADALGIPREEVLAEAGYHVASNSVDQDAWTVCFHEPVSAAGREFLASVYSEWKKSLRVY